MQESEACDLTDELVRTIMKDGRQVPWCILLKLISVRRDVLTTVKVAMLSAMLLCVPRLLVCANRDNTVPAHDIHVYVP